MNLYTDPYLYRRASTGFDTKQLVSNLSRLASPVLVGATSITLSCETTTALKPYDTLTIFDGSSSEVVSVTAIVDQGQTTIPVEALEFAHAAGTPVCGDGMQGSLAELIIDASALVEEHCSQPLLQATHSNEVLPLRSMRASLSKEYALVIRPQQFPVTEVSAISVKLGGDVTIEFDASQAQTDSDGQVITVRPMLPTGGSGSPWCSPFPRGATGFVVISYTAGYPYASLPAEIRRACSWLISDLLSDAQNPSGASEISLGKRTLRFGTRAFGGERSLAQRAYSVLDPYRQRAF